MKTWLCFSWLHLQEYPPAQFHLCTNPLFLVICLDNLKLWCAGYFSSVNAVPPSACSPGELLAGYQLLWQHLPKALLLFLCQAVFGLQQVCEIPGIISTQAPKYSPGQKPWVCRDWFGHPGDKSLPLAALAHSSYRAIRHKPDLHHSYTCFTFFFFFLLCGLFLILCPVL